MTNSPSPIALLELLGADVATTLRNGPSTPVPHYRAELVALCSRLERIAYRLAEQRDREGFAGARLLVLALDRDLRTALEATNG